MIFEYSPKLTKQKKDYLKKHPTFEEDLNKLKKLLEIHFDPNQDFILTPKLLVVDPNIKYRTVHKVCGVAVKGLNYKQQPRIWFKNEDNKIIFLLFMDDHINGYKESESVKEIEKILKEMEL
jgi:hypothetical protein